MRSTIPRLGAVFVSLGLILAACGGTIELRLAGWRAVR